MSEASGVAVGQVTETVLLVMDVQSMIAAPAPSKMIEAVARAIAGARVAGVPVVYVRVVLRPGRAGVSPRNNGSRNCLQHSARGRRAWSSIRRSPRNPMTSC